MLGKKFMTMATLGVTAAALMLAVSGCGGTQNQDATGTTQTQVEQGQTETTPTPTDESSTTATEVSQTQTTVQDEYIGEEAALAKALEHAGIAATDITAHDVSLDLDDGRVHYDVEFMVGQVEYDYDIDAVTGDILGYDAPEIDH